MYSSKMPVSFVNHNNEYLFTFEEECIAVGNYCDGVFHLFEDDTSQKFANAMMAFSHLNSKFRSNELYTISHRDGSSNPVRAV